MDPIHIYFDLNTQEYWHRKEWENRLAAISRHESAEFKLTDSSRSATCIVRTSTPWQINSGPSLISPPQASDDYADGKPCFVWDSGDFPCGREAGLYCSLPRFLYDPRRHRTFCYPICYNECVDYFDPVDAKYLIGFVGGVSSGLRSRLIESLQKHTASSDILLKVQGGPWHQMFDRNGVPAKQEYAEHLRLSKFFLCPRGNGVGSVRLFETMQAGRVPVIISDAYVFPEGIDWGNCSIRIRERDISRIPSILRERSDDWERLALNARKAWEENFSDSALLSSIGNKLRELLKSDSRLSSHWPSYLWRTIPIWTRNRLIRLIIQGKQKFHKK